ncbi:uncharacterized protein LOC124306294 [Neodiprion virginianus]|uniref:uncharacterized protein LOC124306294 n=1 Tax=Neodiprion virginianus TaxID=2961670 RepID=UPI001EE75D94|nr:uncharacterized protein LOC124306294 [Neodiprion virginianus]
MNEEGVFTSRKPSKRRIACSVHGCGSSFQKNRELTFHKFPQKNARWVYQKFFFGKMEKVEQLKAWKNALRIDCKINAHMKVCSLHFQQEDYILPDIPSHVKYLKKTAIPSRNLPRSSVEPRRKKKGESERERRLINRNDQKESSKGMELQHLKTDTILENMEHAEGNHCCIEDVMTENEPEIQVEIKSFANIGVQVKSDDVRLSFEMFVQTDEALSTATGIESIKILDTIVEIARKVTENNSTYSNARMSLRERIIMTYIKLKQNISYSFLALMFNCYTAKHCQRIFDEMISLLSQCLKFAIGWPTKEEISRNLPKCFEDFENVRVVLDCTEIFIQHPTKLCCQVLTYSRYKGSNTCKIMTGVTPAGNISFVSKAYGGRATDDDIFEQSNILSLLEPGDGVMVDRGFRKIDELCERNHFKCIRPPYLKEKTQFSRDEALRTAKIAKARVHIERSNQRIKIFKIVGATMPVNLIPRVEDIFIVICATVNLSSPIIKDDKFMNVQVV